MQLEESGSRGKVENEDYGFMRERGERGGKVGLEMEMVWRSEMG